MNAFLVPAATVEAQPGEAPPESPTPMPRNNDIERVNHFSIAFTSWDWPFVVRRVADAVFAAQLSDRNPGVTVLRHRDEFGFCKPAFLQGSLQLVEAPKFYNPIPAPRGGYVTSRLLKKLQDVTNFVIN